MTTLTDSAIVHACHLDSFILADEFTQHAAGLLLPPKHWEVARALEGGATAAALAPRLRMPATTILAALCLLEERGLVSKVLIPFSGEAAGAEALEKAAHAEAALVMGAPAVLEKKEEPSSKTVKVSLRGNSSAAKPAAVSLRLARTPRKTPSTPATEENTKTEEPACKGWPMQPVLDALRAKTGGDPMVGQLLAYRVFLRVPSALLNEAGIRSVCLIEPDLVIHDPKLKRALETALHEVTGLSWPKPLAQAA